MKKTQIYFEVIWPAAKVLAEYILFNREDFQGKTTLELGAGVGTRIIYQLIHTKGVCGLLMSKFCKKTILTDHMDIVLEILDLNVKNNSSRGYKSLFHLIRTGNSTECRKLAWDVDIDKFKEDFPEGFDIIFGSDIV